MSGIFSSAIRYISIFIIALILSSLLNPLPKPMYVYFFGNGGGFADIDFTDLAILHFTLDFFIPFLVILLGNRMRYWVVAFMGLAIFVPGILINDQYIYNHVGLFIAGGLGGLAIRLIAAHTLGKMPRLEPLKKYF
jgi:hypothetical protein